jgi:serine/threonine-protein kinase RsbT
MAAEIGFSESDRTIISTALSEICRNVIEYAGKGEVTIEQGGVEKDCIIVIVSDQGPGIEDVDQALEEGFSSGMGLGVGLPGAKRIMDQFEIQTSSGEGTTIKMCKWLNNNHNVFR